MPGKRKLPVPDNQLKLKLIDIEPSPPTQERVKKVRVKKRVADLEDRVTRLEAEVTRIDAQGEQDEGED